ncbi:TPA: excalibur calcium-binding domain-containing protein [Streptococcus suis]|nr:excalibur calcium-binding domain-containing protein [Streptococcus suis]
MSKSKNLQANIDLSTNKKRKFFNRKTGAIVGGVVVTAIAGSYLTTAKLPAKEQIFEKNIETVLQEFKDAGFENVKTVEISDIEYGKVSEKTFVETVSVGGEEWKEGSVAKDTPIEITYHSAMKDAMEPQLTENGKIKDVEKEFIQLGFENITLTPILLVAEGNEKKKDIVDSIKIGSYVYQLGYFYSKSLPVTLTYFDVSNDNVKIPENMSKGSSKSEIEKQLKSAGFVNINLAPKTDKDKTMHEKIQSIMLDGKELKLDTKQEIVVKKNVPITVTYSDFSSFAELPNAISTTKVSDTKKLFTDGGFSQVSEQATETNDISKNGQMIAVEIDGKDFNSINDKVITKNSKVIIKYWNAEKAIAEKARKEEEARLAAEEQRILESQAQAQSQIQQFAGTTTGSIYYKNCTAARNAGAAPVRIGDPGYAPHLDRDGDGIGCE